MLHEAGRTVNLPPMFAHVALPVICAPMFIVSTPRLVIAQCKAGIVGSIPALNARPASLLDDWLAEITETLAAHDRAHPQTPSAPFAVNQIVHASNDRLDQDLAVCAKHKVPLTITSLGARIEVNDAVHGWGGIVMHDVISDRFAHKAIDKGADGLIAVAAGAGGHAGTTSPFALVQEIRRWFDGPLALAGAIATGRAVLAAQVMGADFAYIGSAFIATDEARADPRYKQMVVDSSSADIVYSNAFSGVHANFLRAAIAAAGLDPDRLHELDTGRVDFGTRAVKPWKDIWSCGHGAGAIEAVTPTAALVARLARDYDAARVQMTRGRDAA